MLAGRSGDRVAAAVADLERDRVAAQVEHQGEGEPSPAAIGTIARPSGRGWSVTCQP